MDSPNLETAQEMLEERQLVQTLAQDPQRFLTLYIQRYKESKVFTNIETGSQLNMLVKKF